MTNSEILVSVVIPAYNAAGYIGQALDSVRAQSLSVHEIIVVNDGSPDTEQLEAALLPYSSQIRYLKQENRGPSAARNRGILAACGQYVAFLDSDDCWLPEHLSTQISILRKDPSVGLVYSDSLLMKNGIVVGRTFERESQILPVTFDSLLEELSTVSLSTTVASRKDLIDAGLFDETLVRCEDFDLWLRMAFRGTKITHHSQAGVRRTVSPNGLSSDEYRMRVARAAVLNKIGSTMALSDSQKELLAKRLRLVNAMANLDRLKMLISAGQFEEALEAAREASTVLRSWKLRLVVSGLRRAPRVVQAYYKLHEQLLAMRNRRRSARYARLAMAKSARKAVPETC